MTLLKGCDVSVFQAPTLVPWRDYDFGICRATYGKSPDKKVLQHVEAIRNGGAVLGLYHFFRADQDVDQQYDVFRSVAQQAGLGVGELLPCIDIEDFPGHTIGPADAPKAEAFAARCDTDFGGAIIYITQRDWHRLGKPAWVLDRPLWVAHYPGKGSTSILTKPATPNGAPWRIWQCMVGRLGTGTQDHTDKLAVDQNLASDPLPLIESQTRCDSQIPEVPWVGITDEAYEEMREARDRHIREMDQ